jgi:hypothetical protein
MGEEVNEAPPVDYTTIDRRNIRAQCLHAAVDLHRGVTSNDLVGCILEMADKFANFVLADG